MKMSTALLNGTEAESHGRKLSLKDVVESHFEPSKMKNIASPGAELDKLLTSKVNDNDVANNAEMISMKELFEIHLDYMQQQSEQLSKKEKIIDDLKNENEMLKQRMARMERRVSLQKVRGEKKPAEAETVGRKRRSTADAPLAPAPPPPPGKKPPTGSSVVEPKRPKQEKNNAELVKQESDENENEPAINLDNILTTRIAYHTLVGEKPNCLLKYVRRSKKQKPAHLQVEVPLWRVKHLSSTYTMEGTENLSDDVFERRHYKLMVDEKKRKRWDVQRIREQRQKERSRAREERDKIRDRQYKSLWPQHAEGLKLSVTPLVPVSIFGINLPAPTIQDFSLPWKEGTRQVSCRRRTKR